MDQDEITLHGANGNVLEWPVSTNNGQNGQVTADIDHFSKYAVAY